MGNCSFRGKPSIYRASSDGRSGRSPFFFGNSNNMILDIDFAFHALFMIVLYSYNQEFLVILLFGEA